MKALVLLAALLAFSGCRHAVPVQAQSGGRGWIYVQAAPYQFVVAAIDDKAFKEALAKICPERTVCASDVVGTFDLIRVDVVH